MFLGWSIHGFGLDVGRRNACREAILGLSLGEGLGLRTAWHVSWMAVHTSAADALLYEQRLDT